MQRIVPILTFYSPKDDAITVVSDEASAEFEELDALKQPQVKRPMTAHEYKKECDSQ